MEAVTKYNEIFFQQVLLNSVLIFALALLYNRKNKYMFIKIDSFMLNKYLKLSNIEQKWGIVLLCKCLFLS